MTQLQEEVNQGTQEFIETAKRLKKQTTKKKKYLKKLKRKYEHIKKKKKKGKRGGKQNAMQQSRDARVRKMKADMEERRKKRDEKLNNSSGGDSGSENGGSDTESFGSNDHGERTKAANSRPMRCPLMFISNHHIRPKGEDDAKEEYRLNPRVVAVFQNTIVIY